jgi:hypothetical protein
VFNVIVRGWLAVAMVLVVAGALAVATQQVYRLRPGGWWLGVGTVVAATLLLLPSVFMMPLADYYAAMGVDLATLEPMLKRPWIARGSTAAMLVLVTLTFVIYMVRAKPAFDAAVSHPKPTA